MTDDKTGTLLRSRPRHAHGPTAADFAALFGLSEGVAARLLARPCSETQTLRAIAALIGAEPSGWGELAELYAGMTPTQQADILASARASAALALK